MVGHADVDDAPRLELHDDEHVEDCEKGSVLGHEVAGEDLSGVILDEGSPGLRTDSRASDHVLSNRACGVRDVELNAQLFEDLVLAPARVVTAHSSDEEDVLTRDGGPADLLSSRLSAPVEPEALAVPTYHGLRFDENQGGPPSAPEAGEPDPEDSIGWPKTRALSDPLVDGELLSQGQVFEDESLSSLEECSECGGREGENRGHQRILADSEKLNDLAMYGVSADYGARSRRGPGRQHFLVSIRNPGTVILPINLN